MEGEEETTTLKRGKEERELLRFDSSLKKGGRLMVGPLNILQKRKTPGRPLKKE